MLRWFSAPAPSFTLCSATISLSLCFIEWHLFSNEKSLLVILEFRCIYIRFGSISRYFTFTDFILCHRHGSSFHPSLRGGQKTLRFSWYWYQRVWSVVFVRRLHTSLERERVLLHFNMQSKFLAWKSRNIVLLHRNHQSWRYYIEISEMERFCDTASMVVRKWIGFLEHWQGFWLGIWFNLVNVEITS